MNQTVSKQPPCFQSKEWRWLPSGISGSWAPSSARSRLAELVQQAADGKIDPDTEIRKGNGAWVPASKVAGLFDRAARSKVAPAPAVAPPPDPPKRSTSSSPRRSQRWHRPPRASKFEVIDSAEDDGFRVEILAYSKLGGAKDHQTAATVYFANQAGIRLKQVRITLRDGEAIAESGALHFMLGQIQMESKIGGVSGLGKAMMNKFVTKEAAVMPRYRGTGQIYLEPSFSHFLIYRLNGEEVIADKGMFYCGQGSLDVGSAMQKNVSSALFGGEGLFQTRIRGTGICVLESPVPADEVLRIDLKDETLAGGRQLRPDADRADRVLGREVHEEPAGDADQRRGAAPDVPGDRLGLAGPDSGHLPAVCRRAGSLRCRPPRGRRTRRPDRSAGSHQHRRPGRTNSWLLFEKLSNRGCMNPDSPSSAVLEPVRVLGSPGLTGWLRDQRLSLAFTTYQSGKLLLLGRKPDDWTRGLRANVQSRHGSLE